VQTFFRAHQNLGGGTAPHPKKLGALPSNYPPWLRACRSQHGACNQLLIQLPVESDTTSSNATYNITECELQAL